MRRRVVVLSGALALTIAMCGCKVREEADAVTNGTHGPTSPAESGQQGPTAFNRAPFEESKKVADQEHQTAGLATGPITNGKVDPTMEGSGNLAWQGSYEKEKRQQASAANQNAGAGSSGGQTARQ